VAATVQTGGCLSPALEFEDFDEQGPASVRQSAGPQPDAMQQV